MGELIQFPGKADDALLDRAKAIRALDDEVDMGTCQGVIHVFDEVPGTCHCGTETWTPEGLLDAPSDVIGIHAVS